ncbi:MAG TPA: GNAT family N-acetyltransferase [Cyanobacteria bacterium UBA8553]|nr:GNAT family N-acetyltransferase [Cyanobacteria bacterium UBA8553]HAJ59570.1 GNAT family N-acetyltransferase [Cyanobacteria bacterium UBA8543]
MKLNHFEDVNEYYDRVKPYLIQHEAHHNLIFGMIDSLRSQPEYFTHPPYLVTVQEDDHVATVAIRTPPRKLVLSRTAASNSANVPNASLNLQALNTIAQDLHARQELIPGVIAPVDEAQAFVQAWQAVTSQSYRLAMRQRVYQLESVKPVHKANGHFRQATLADFNLLVNWCQKFYQEASGEATKYDETKRTIDRHLKKNALFLWQDKVPVCVASFSGLTPNGIRIGFVYTPPQYRRNGYASSCVAALSQTLIDRGHKYCFLFTDLANPTSNHIYQAIGYQPVADINDYVFESYSPNKSL